jgi:hypothetical protein
MHIYIYIYIYIYTYMYSAISHMPAYVYMADFSIYVYDCVCMHGEITPNNVMMIQCVNVRVCVLRCLEVYAYLYVIK